MRLTFLGTGTSMGIPVIGCCCAVCTSADPRNKRLRTSALLEVAGMSLLFDAGPDLRQQALAAVCTSADPRNKRLRTSALLEVAGMSLLFDAGPDLRQQALAVGLQRLDAVLLTHAHADHV